MKLFKRMLSVFVIVLLVVISVPVVPVLAAESQSLSSDVLSIDGAFDVPFSDSVFGEVFKYDSAAASEYMDLINEAWCDDNLWNTAYVSADFQRNRSDFDYFLCYVVDESSYLSFHVITFICEDGCSIDSMVGVFGSKDSFWDSVCFFALPDKSQNLRFVDFSVRYEPDNEKFYSWNRYDWKFFSSASNNYCATIANIGRDINSGVIACNFPMYSAYEVNGSSSNSVSSDTYQKYILPVLAGFGFTDLRTGCMSGQTDNRFGFDVFQTSVNNLGSNGWGVHNGYRIKNNIPNTTIASYDLNYHITWQISAGVTSERGLTENKTFTYEVNEVRQGSPSGSGFEDFELNDALNDEDKTIFSLILNSSTDNSSTIGSNIIKTGVSIGSLFLGPYREPVGLVGNWIASLPTSFGDDTDLYLQGITCYIECYPSTSKMEGVLSSTSTNLFTGASTSFLYPPVEDGSDDVPVLEKKPSTLDNVKTYDDGSHSYYPSSANGGNSNSSSSATGGSANAWINMPETITVMLQGVASGGGSNSGHCDVTVLDDDVSKDELLEVLASGYGLLDDVATDERSDGFLNMLRHFYGAIDPRLGTIMMFGVGTSISVLIIRNILRH